MILSTLIFLLVGKEDTTKFKQLDLHFQQTMVVQYKPSFAAKYSDVNSLIAKSEHQETITSTLFFNYLAGSFTFRLHPEVSGGSGLSQVHGIAGFTNGEAFRVGSAAATLYMARMLVEYSRGSWFLMAGKFSQTDYLQQSSYSNNARTQFLNWALMAPGAWDYGANTRGYTGGLLARKVIGKHTLQAAVVMVPTEANGPDLSWNIKRNHQTAIEYSYRFGKSKREGMLSVLAYTTKANMGNYSLAVRQGQEGNYYPTLDSAKISGGTTKTGIALYFEKKISHTIGVFGRLSMNDGKNETWAFTEIDQSIALGASYQNALQANWLSEIGIAIVGNGISKSHRRYLATGGYGFILGDGALSFGPEIIMECYARLPFFRKEISVSPNYQFVINPGYNKDRGPVHVFGFRAHVEI